MGIRTLIQYWFGSRRAIERIAQSRSGLWLGLIFVLAAGFAREYDGEYLVREPWHVLLPLPVSFVLAVVFFGLFRLGMKRDERYPGAGPAFRAFLTLFWLAAPLAFFYAIPYERFLSPGAAVEANLWTLAVVVLWRALLMARIAQVVFGARSAGAFCVVMLVGDAIAFVALSQLSLPVIDLMGGIRLTEGEQAIASATLLVMILGFYSGFVWLIGAAFALATRHMRWRLPCADESAPASLLLKAVAVASVLVWALVLPATQPEQRLRWEVERALKLGRIESALATMSAHRQEDFPPHWDPPPRPGYDEVIPPLLDVLDRLGPAHAAPWIRQIYIEKLVQRYITVRHWPVKPEDWARVERLLVQLKEGPALAQDHREEVEHRRAVAADQAPATQAAGGQQP